MKKIVQNLLPCPACGGHNIIRNGYYRGSLICRDCYYEIASIEENASQEEMVSLWNRIRNIDDAISFCNEKVAKANIIARKFSDLRNHYIQQKIRIATKQREKISNPESN